LTYIDGKTNIMCLHCVSNRMSSTLAMMISYQSMNKLCTDTVYYIEMKHLLK